MAQQPKIPRSKPIPLTPSLSPGPSTAYSAGSLPRDRYTTYNAPSSDDGSLGALDPPTFAVPQSPASPRQSSRSFWSGYRATRRGRTQTPDDAKGRLPSASSSTSNLYPPSAPQRPVTPVSASATDQSYGNLVDSLSVSDRNAHDSGDQEYTSEPLSREELDALNQRRPSKNTFSQLVGRSLSGKTDSNPRHSIKATTPKPHLDTLHPGHGYEDNPHTAPLESERGYREMFNKTLNREKSADRALPNSRDGSEVNFKASTPSDSGGLFSGFKGTTTRTGESGGKSGKGFLSRFTRGGPVSNEPLEPVDPNYVLRIIRRPLAMQTQAARIKPRIEDALDKTEYWLPSLPYRCIEYLNAKASEEEGLYRVPGADRDIKYWEKRFDTELDVNLLDQTQLYDPNTVGSLLKAWLRELPDEVFPRSTQIKLAGLHPGAKSAPQALRDELSRLPPYNYYLLFAVTCHIAILLSKADKNKMTFPNLAVCFQPCTRLEHWAFQLLICDWPNCWQGCWTEKEWYQREEDGGKEGRDATPAPGGGGGLSVQTTSPVRLSHMSVNAGAE